MYVLQLKAINGRHYRPIGAILRSRRPFRPATRKALASVNYESLPRYGRGVFIYKN